jgi:hypothetical protein
VGLGGLHRADAGADDIEELFMTKDEALDLALAALEKLKQAFFKNASTAEEIAQGCDRGYEDYEAEFVEPALRAVDAIKQALAQPAPVAFEVGLVEWVDNKLMATPKVTTTPPASWVEMVTANLVREGVNKHKARELAEHFYGLSQPAPVQEPVADFDDAQVQTVYNILCDADEGKPREEHWEGWKARRIVAALTTPPAQPAVPDAFGTREGEHPQYIQGWNDCRAAMLEMMKARKP